MIIFEEEDVLGGMAVRQVVAWKDLSDGRVPRRDLRACRLLALDTGHCTPADSDVAQAALPFVPNEMYTGLQAYPGRNLLVESDLACG